MKILLVNTSSATGGAAIAARRLMDALEKNGAEVKMLVRDKDADDPRVVALPPSFLLKAKFVAERAEIFLENNFKKHRLFEVDHAAHGTDITRLPIFEWADVIHLHWVNQGMLSLDDIGEILKSGKQVWWTLHDMWPFTGICHHARQCEGWKKECGNCQLLVNGGNKSDLSHRTFKKKQKVYRLGDVRIVACSNWLADLARKAPLFKNFTVESIPNPIDTTFYTPGDKTEARKKLGLPLNKKLLLFVAYRATDRNKGIYYLGDALTIIQERNADFIAQMGLIIVGREADAATVGIPCECFPQGYVTDAEKMLLCYQAADLLVMPTLQDNLPNTIAEAMACGTPCVGFRVGGLPQMIAHRRNGYLSRYLDAADFADGILETVFSDGHETYATDARQTAVTSYAENVIAERFLNYTSDNK
jgi:glycosyltransferase involved in cell wall biosynthesis